MLDEVDGPIITLGKENVTTKVLPTLDVVGNVTNQGAMDANFADLVDYGKRFKKVISILTKSIDDSLVELLNFVP